MRKRHNISILAVVVVGLSAALGTARAQDSSSQPVPGNAQDSSQQQPTAPPETPPSPAYGPDNAEPNKTAPISENPPISALDQPALGPHAAPLSYLQPGATVSEAADSNVADTLGGGAVRSVTRALGTLTLRRLWSNYEMALDYAGGVGYYNVGNVGLRNLQQLGFEQKINWKRGQFAVRDDFSYLPEGNFGASYGSLTEQQSTLGAGFGQSFLGGNNFGQLGEVPRLTNVAAADISESLSPKSALTLAGGYGLVHFYGSDPELQGVPFLGSTQVSAQGGYDRVLNPHDQVALIYGYQAFRFTPGGCTLSAGTCVGPSPLPGTAFHSQVVELAYAHRISGRMDFTISAGPQIIQLSECTALFGLCAPDTTTADTRLGVAGRALLRYKFPKTSVEASYLRMTTAGSGFFAGAESDIAHLQVNRPLTRRWSGFVDLGYSRNSRIEPVAFGAINANTFSYGFIGGGVHRMLGRNFHAFASYQFGELSFDDSVCVASAPCNRISQRHTGTIGLDWKPRPMRID